MVLTMRHVEHQSSNIFFSSGLRGVGGSLMRFDDDFLDDDFLDDEVLLVAFDGSGVLNDWSSDAVFEGVVDDDFDAVCCGVAIGDGAAVGGSVAVGCGAAKGGATSGCSVAVGGAAVDGSAAVGGGGGAAEEFG